MTDLEPSLSQVHSDLVGRMEHDRRIRDLEVGHAGNTAEIRGLRDEVHAFREDAKVDKAELLNAIQQNRPDAPWKAITAVVAIIMLAFGIAAAIYTGTTP